MSSPEKHQNQNETFEPSEAMKILEDSPSFEEHMRRVKAKREFQEKYGDHPIIDEGSEKSEDENPFGSASELGPDEFI